MALLRIMTPLNISVIRWQFLLIIYRIVCSLNRPPLHNSANIPIHNSNYYNALLLSSILKLSKISLNS